jgi:hypothetical protein
MFRRRSDRIKGVSGSLEGKKVLVADAVAGPGAGIVHVISRAGGVVLASAADSAMLDVTIGKIESPPAPITPLACPEQLRASLPEGVDGVVINPDHADTIESVQVWIDLAGTVATSMQDRGHAGSIVFITTIERTGFDGSVAAFLHSEMENLADSLAPNAIRVNAVSCGPVDATARGRPKSSRITPLGHITVHPIDVGKAVWFLLNEDLSSAMTGSTVRVDRGASLVRPDW